MPPPSSLLRDDEKAVFDALLSNETVFSNYISKVLIQNKKALESEKRKQLRIATNTAAMVIGFSGNVLYYSYSIDFAKRLEAPDELEKLIGWYLAICNVITNGCLTAFPLVDRVNALSELLTPYEKKIAQSEIPTFTRAFFNFSAFTISFFGILSSAYLAYRPNKSYARGLLLIASNIGFPWLSLYLLSCTAYVTRKLSPEEKKIEAAKGAMIHHLQMIKNQIVRNKIPTQIIVDDINTLINILGAEDIQDDDSRIKTALTILYSFQSQTISQTPPDKFETSCIPPTSLILTFSLMLFYWYGGGYGGKVIVADITGSDHSETAAFYSFASLSVICALYSCYKSVDGTHAGIYSWIKNKYYGTYLSGLSDVLFPRMARAWTALSLSSTLGTWGFAAEHALLDFPPVARWLALTLGLVAVLFLHGWGMMSIKDMVVFFLMKPFASKHDNQVIQTYEKLTSLQDKTKVASHEVFAHFIQQALTIIESTEKFGITQEEINHYFESISKKHNEKTPLLIESGELKSYTDSPSSTPGWSIKKSSRNISINSISSDSSSQWSCVIS